MTCSGRQAWAPYVMTVEMTVCRCSPHHPVHAHSSSVLLRHCPSQPKSDVCRVPVLQHPEGMCVVLAGCGTASCLPSRGCLWARPGACCHAKLARGALRHPSATCVSFDKQSAVTCALTWLGHKIWASLQGQTQHLQALQSCLYCRALDSAIMPYLCCSQRGNWTLYGSLIASSCVRYVYCLYSAASIKRTHFLAYNTTHLTSGCRRQSCLPPIYSQMDAGMEGAVLPGSRSSSVLQSFSLVRRPNPEG